MNDEKLVIIINKHNSKEVKVYQTEEQYENELHNECLRKSKEIVDLQSEIKDLKFVIADLLDILQTLYKVLDLEFVSNGYIYYISSSSVADLNKYDYEKIKYAIERYDKEITQHFYFSNESDDCECGTDEDFDTHADDVANGYGYYDENGKYVSYGKEAI